MTKHFNDLTPAEAERLAYLIEECAEVQQIACKVLRHGYNSLNPDRREDGPNRAQLSRELVDLAGAIARMIDSEDVGPSVLKEADPKKGQRYMHHQTT